MIYKIKALILNHLPVWCAKCGYVMFKKNAKYEETRWGTVVPLCNKCHKEIFTPFSKDK